MQVCFIRDGVSLIMPVTPERYQWTSGKRIETININELGDVYRPGGMTRFSGNLDFLLPAQDYPWMEAGSHAEPQYYLDYLTAWATDEKTVRLVITGTEINTLVYIEDVTQSEKDGTVTAMLPWLSVNTATWRQRKWPRPAAPRTTAGQTTPPPPEKRSHIQSSLETPSR